MILLSIGDDLGCLLYGHYSLPNFKMDRLEKVYTEGSLLISHRCEQLSSIILHEHLILFKVHHPAEPLDSQD